MGGFSNSCPGLTVPFTIAAEHLTLPSLPHPHSGAHGTRPQRSDESWCPVHRVVSSHLGFNGHLTSVELGRQRGKQQSRIQQAERKDLEYPSALDCCDVWSVGSSSKPPRQSKRISKCLPIEEALDQKPSVGCRESSLCKQKWEFLQPREALGSRFPRQVSVLCTESLTEGGWKRRHSYISVSSTPWLGSR